MKHWLLASAVAVGLGTATIAGAAMTPSQSLSRGQSFSEAATQAAQANGSSQTQHANATSSTRTPSAETLMKKGYSPSETMSGTSVAHISMAGSGPATNPARNAPYFHLTRHGITFNDGDRPIL